MKKVYIENDAVVVEAEGAKRYFATFVAAAEALGLTQYEDAEALMEAVEARGTHEVA